MIYRTSVGPGNHGPAPAGFVDKLDGRTACVKLRPVADPKTIDRIHKLLRLAESSNVHEAATAAARAQALMERHRIERATLDLEPDSIRDHRDRPLVSASRLPQWRAMLATVVAESNGCRVYLRRERASSHVVVVGTREDAVHVAALEAHLSAEVERLTRAIGHGRGRRWCTHFRLGAVSTLGLRLRQARDRARAEARRQAQDAESGPTGAHALARLDTALCRLDQHDAGVDAFMRERLRLTTPRRRPTRLQPDAFAEGRQAAASVDLDARRRLPDTRRTSFVDRA